MNTRPEHGNRSLPRLNNRGLAGALGLLLLLPVAAWAGGVVTNCTEADLRAAMAGGGTVTFACDGTIRLSSTITNDLDVKLDGSGHQVTICGDAGVPDEGVRFFCVHTNVNLTLVNLTIHGGLSRGGSAILNLGGTVNLSGVALNGNTATLFVSNDGFAPQGSGGAIFNRGGTVVATNCAFLGNTAQAPAATDFGGEQIYGGAIRNEAGQVVLRSCVFTGNQASGGDGHPLYGGNADPGLGGAIHNSGTVTLDLCAFTGNSATGGDACDVLPWLAGLPGGEGSGGAIFNQGTLTLDRCSFSRNTGKGGAGGAGGGPPSGSPTLDGYPGGAGGEAHGGAICNLASCWITRGKFGSNLVTGGAGGAGGPGGSFMYEYGGNGGNGGNGGSGLGGALFSSGGASLVNCTIAFNTGSGAVGGRGGMGAPGGHWSGSGGAGGDGGSALGGVYGTCNLTNCTIALNVGTAGAGGDGGDYGGPSQQPGTNGPPGADGVAWGGTACGSLIAMNTLCASNSPGTNDSFADPKLGPLADNGGPTLTMALLPGSPAIDAGDTSLAPTTDQRGFPRPAGLAADIGAFEYGSVMPTLAISRSGATGLDILGSGNAGQSCRLLSSPDMSSWVPIATNQIGGDGTVLFYEACASGSACRYYRLVMP